MSLCPSVEKTCPSVSLSKNMSLCLSVEKRVSLSLCRKKICLYVSLSKKNMSLCLSVEKKYVSLSLCRKKICLSVSLSKKHVSLSLCRKKSVLLSEVDSDQERVSSCFLRAFRSSRTPMRVCSTSALRSAPSRLALSILRAAANLNPRTFTRL